LYGSIPPEARCTSYEKAHPFFNPSAAKCVPCWDKQFFDPALELKCRTEGPMCLNSIQAEDVLDKVKEILK
jgi:hypothetical protein